MSTVTINPSYFYGAVKSVTKHSAMKLFMYLVANMDENNAATLDQGEFCEDYAISRPTINGWVKHLASKGLIRKVGTSNRHAIFVVESSIAYTYRVPDAPAQPLVFAERMSDQLAATSV